MYWRKMGLCSKTRSGGKEVKYKARYVAKAFSQVGSIDYDETFSPTAQMSSSRMLIQSSVDQDVYI